MSWDVVPVANRSRWGAALARVGCTDPYYLAAYHDAYGYDGGSAFLYVGQVGDDVLVHPVRRHSVDHDLCDLESVYGYTGPLATSDDPRFLLEAWAGFDTWCADQRVVSEFCRFHPLLDTRRFAHPGMAVVEDRDVVVMDLTGGEETLWGEYPPIQRNCVRKAQAAGLSCRRLDYAEGGGAFRAIYHATMRGLGADPFYEFTPAYWQALDRLGDAVTVITVERGGETIAAGLFLAGDGVAHYHLSGSLLQYRGLCPNNLMLHDAALWAMAKGARALLLGGGRTSRPDDSLLKFKQSLSRRRRSFFIGKRVCSPDAYARLSAQWCARAGVEKPPPVLQHYRYPVGGK